MASGGRRPPVRWLWALRDDRALNSNAKHVFYALWTRGADARPSLATLASDCQLGRSTVKRALAELAESGWLAVERRRTNAGDNDTSRYVLACPKAARGRSTADRGGVQSGPPGGSTADPKVVKGKGKTEVGNKQTSTRKRAAAHQVEGQEAMPGLLVAMPSVEIVAKVPTAKEVVAAYVDGAEAAEMPKPSKAYIGRVARDAKRLLGEGADPEELLEAGRLMGAGPWNDLERQVRLSRSGYRRMGSPDERTAGTLSLVEQIAGLAQ